ncbi:MAG: HIRAN domain-containing protein [Candidatus Margulisbacteria bacterium]|nr:HIRAN domain-containing protein [Patescibacteria group bacterium]MBU1617185.1 HIRAN domain-containing protein [Candidatus Margulisiibacteriota bacterium]
MKWIENIIEPHRLLLTWQPSDTKNRLRRIIGELINDGEKVKMNYLIGTKDYEEAKKLGFNGFASFSLDSTTYDNVLDVFMKRLPPRNRSDFNKYMEAIRIPIDKQISDFALLGYSGARLPDDDYTIVHPFENVQGRCEVLTEICGFRHNEGVKNVDELEIGQAVFLAKEPNNQFDSLAVKIMFNNKRLGYINRVQIQAFNEWINNNSIEEVTIEKINGSKESPKVYVFVKVNNKT